jgi:hypothetical protein
MRSNAHPIFVMPGLVPGICATFVKDGRDKPGHDELRQALEPFDAL